MLEARSVALVGASPRPGSFGQRMIGEVGRSPSGPDIYLVNPRYRQIGERACYPSLADLPGPADLVLLGVPDAALEQQLSLAARCRSAAAVIFGNAHEEPPGRGPAAACWLRDRLAAIAAGAGMQLCGAGCMGFVNVARGLRAIGYVEPDQLPAGPVALVTHSGSVFSAMLRSGRAVGFTLAVSSGQELVTTAAAYLEYALALPETRVIALVLEAMREPARLRAVLASAAARDIPVVLLAVGSSASGQAMVAAHSGALAARDGGWEALADAYGVHRAGDLAELTDTLELFAIGRRAQLPPSPTTPASPTTAHHPANPANPAAPPGPPPPASPVARWWWIARSHTPEVRDRAIHHDRPGLGGEPATAAQQQAVRDRDGARFGAGARPRGGPRRPDRRAVRIDRRADAGQACRAARSRHAAGQPAGHVGHRPRRAAAARRLTRGAGRRSRRHRGRAGRRPGSRVRRRPVLPGRGPGRGGQDREAGHRAGQLRQCRRPGVAGELRRAGIPVLEGMRTGLLALRHLLDHATGPDDSRPAQPPRLRSAPRVRPAPQPEPALRPRPAARPRPQRGMDRSTVRRPGRPPGDGWDEARRAAWRRVAGGGQAAGAPLLDLLRAYGIAAARAEPAADSTPCWPPRAQSAIRSC